MREKILEMAEAYLDFKLTSEEKDVILNAVDSVDDERLRQRKELTND